MAGRILILRPTSLSEFAERCEFPHELIVVILSNSMYGIMVNKINRMIYENYKRTSTILIN